MYNSVTLGRWPMGIWISEGERKGQKPRGTNSIPSNPGGKSRSVGAWVAAACDIIEAIPVHASFVQPVVEKAERVLATFDQIVIKQSDDGRRGLYIGG